MQGTGYATRCPAGVHTKSPGSLGLTALSFLLLLLLLLLLLFQSSQLLLLLFLLVKYSLLLLLLPLLLLSTALRCVLVALPARFG